MSHSVYKHWDKKGKLLYVGCSAVPLHRTNQHRGSDWFAKVAKVTIEHFKKKDEALHEEARAIIDNDPEYNKMHSQARIKSLVANGTATSVQQAIENLISQHGGLCRAARANGISAAYLSRLRHAEKENPSDRMLKILGLERSVTFKRAAK